MGKMKALAINMMEQQQEDVKTYPLSSIIEEDLTSNDLEEAHYVHTMNAFVELIVLYGWDKVTTDLRAAMGEKKW